jgi:hypothetical protein
MQSKPTVTLYTSWRTNIEKLSPEESKLFLTKIFEKNQGEEESEIPTEMVRLDAFWDSIQYAINEHLRKYEKQMNSQKK